MIIQFNVKPTCETFIAPSKGTQYSAGYDLFATSDVILKKGEAIIIDLGFQAEFFRLDESGNWTMDGIGCTILPRSGTGFKSGSSFANTVPLIDVDFRKNWLLKMYLPNEVFFPDVYEVKYGTAIAQAVFQELGYAPEGVRIVHELSDSDRADGFGHTDKTTTRF